LKQRRGALDAEQPLDGLENLKRRIET